MFQKKASPEPSIKHSRRILEYTLDQRMFDFHSKKGRGNCENQRCGEPLKVGDRIVRHYGHYGGKCRLFHKKCAQELNII